MNGERVLRRSNGAASGQTMPRRFASLLVLFGLLFGIVFMPVIAHASENPAHAAEMLEISETGDVEDTGTRGSDKDVPCHAASHHHCSVALQLGAPRINLNGLATALLLHPASTAALASHSQAPPLEPPAA